MDRKRQKLPLYLALLGAAVFQVCAQDISAGEEEDIALVGTPDFVVTTQDVKNYLRALPQNYAGAFDWGSTSAVNQAMIDLYALRTIALEAQKAGLLASVEEQWLKDYLWSMEAATVLMNERVEKELAAVDWPQLALEHYLANRSDFKTETAITIRTLLLSVEDRTYVEAWSLAESLLRPEWSFDEFRDVVDTWTDDQAAKKASGLMKKVAKGETVPQFEAAAFELTTPGEVSEPVATQFGVHLIQLIERHPPRIQDFEEVRDDIVDQLKYQHEIQFKQGLRTMARTAEPEGFFIDEERIAELMKEVEQTAESSVGK